MPSKEKAKTYSCGIVPEIEISNTDPLENLGVNEVFTAGDFPVTVKIIEGEQGNYSGKGYIVVPYLADTKIAVEFKNIRINTDYQLVEGKITTTYDATWGGVMDVQETIDDVENFANLLVKVIEGLINEIVDSLKDGQDANTIIEMWEEIIDDNQNGLSEEQRKELKEHLKNNKDKIKEGVKQLREKIEKEGIDDEIVKKNLVSNFSSSTSSSSTDDSSKSPNDTISRIIASLLKENKNGLIKCKKCTENNQIPDAAITLKIVNETYACVVATIIEGGINLLSSNQISDTASTGVGKYYNNFKNYIKGKSNSLLLFSLQKEIQECTVKYPLPDSFCNNPNLEQTHLEQIAEEVESCYSVALNEVENTLLALSSKFRDSQLIQYKHNGKVYQLVNNELKQLENPLSDDEIEAGKWTNTKVNQIFRVHKNNSKIFQFSAVGIRNNLTIISGKQADLASISKNMKDKGNRFLLSSKVLQVEDTPAKKNLRLASDAFADGKKINIDENVSFFKIISEGAGLLGTLLKTGEIEKPTYLENPNGDVVIQAPPIVTGTTEAGARAVTDITGVVVLVYDLAVDKETRKNTWQGLKSVKDQIIEKPATLFPILKDIVVEEATGNTPENWNEIKNISTDDGRKEHLITKGSTRTAITVFTSGKLILELPKIATKLALKLSRGKILKRIDNLGWDEALKEAFKKDFDYPNNKDFKELFEKADEVRQAELLQSWKTIQEAISNQFGTTQFALDTKTINKVADYFNNDKLASIGGIDELKSFIANTLMCLVLLVMVEDFLFLELAQWMK